MNTAVTHVAISNITGSNTSYRPHWIKEDFVDFVLAQFNPLWAMRKIKTTIKARQALGNDMYKVVLSANVKFKSQWRAGQSILVTVQIHGIHHQRSYSIVDIDAKGQIILGIKAQGLVSDYLCKSADDMVLEISQVQGDFVLHHGKAPVLMIASGSGITAIYAMVKQAIAQNFESVHLIYFNRAPVFHVELEQLSQQYPQFHYHFIDTSSTKQYLDEALLNSQCADWQSIHTYICGSTPMMKSAKAIFEKYNISNQLHSEYFQPCVDDSAIAQLITFRRAQRDFIATRTLLESAEDAGLRPTSGCRMGICNRCTCTKVSGVTKNIITGEIDQSDNQQIKLCVSQALSPVTIDL
ncbi:Ferredoxin-NADP reductase [Acinetobacter marinus]|uniref:Ferredoxin-NADP reductase n=1 Tax=Acinetobacter marinus TaxID=281375 RepID=A0A1G6PEA6_9GAMM|nr:iron-sulfur cluster-binding domain-containing protein [Acinetobacter marinus]SDC78473.1 Ferredoxin-NADP reductase [Acinetobacter marinus]